MRLISYYKSPSELAVTENSTLEGAALAELHLMIVNLIIVKNTCVSHNNSFAGKRMGRHGYISLL